MNKILQADAAALINMALREDLNERGDITVKAILNPEAQRFARIVAKQDGVACGTEFSEMVFKTVDAGLEVQICVRDGDLVNNRDLMMSVYGRTASILQAERTALNFLGHLSGISTLTHQFVKAVSHTNAKCLDTRKTTPGWRRLEKYAVDCGGGVNHRMGLYDMFLIKENHIAAAGGIKAAVEQCRRAMRQRSFLAEIEVETTTLDQVRQACELEADRIMLDNMSPELMRECVEWVNGRVELEASGNVSIKSVAAIAETGVDFISVGALTHSAGTFDASLLLDSV
ncbi:MAG: carboxylating nicotinate-nucleotide diphosphorylase [candidate division KSB1 bacterium]|nr:carboxylating nicotinate-nucleotide diphosphorylase [candidate division KSB1 bacterium]